MVNRARRWRKWRHVLSKATPQIKRPALIGAAVIGTLVLLALLGVSNTHNLFYVPETMGEAAVSYQVWGMRPSNLLMALPIGAFLVVLARSFVGMKAFGLFTPMLIAIAFLQIGPVFGPLVLCSAIGVGMVVAPALLKLRMTRVGFLGVLISFVVFVLALLQEIIDSELQIDAFPVVVTALCVERWHRTWEKDGFKASTWIALNTFVLALMIQFVMVSRIALALIDISPLVLPGFAGLAIALLGRYRGLRLSELKRFAPIWLEGRRNANIAQILDGEAPAAADVAEPAQRPEPVAEPFADPVARPVPEPVDAPVPAAAAIAAGPATQRLPAFPIPSFGRARRNQDAETADRRDPRYQSAQRHYRQVQSALGDRKGARQGGREGGAERGRRGHHGHGGRHLQLWGPAWV